ncbi:MAG: AAA family ATPase [Solirubrobacterales bacterium]|nr:AAA family ATPase [Solirubrobacterales bacterium]
MPETFDITIGRTVFRAPDSAFAVLQGTTSEGEPRTLCGELGSFTQGDRLEVTANAGSHPRFGPRWDVESAVVREPDDRASRKVFLESIDGIGEGRAEELLDLFGDDVFDQIDRAPEAVFGGLTGVGTKTARKAAKSWQERRQIRELVGLLHSARIDASQGIAARAAKAFGPECVEKVRSDPFSLIDLPGVGFRDADRLASHLEFPPDSSDRIRAACLHLLREAKASEGHLFLTHEDLAARAGQLLALPLDRFDLGIDLQSARGVVDRDGRFYLASAYRAETNFAADVWMLATDLDRTITIDPESLDPSLTESQRYAVAGCLGQRLTLITGPPGVGKTTIIREVVRCAREHGLTVALTAPTGRAATRMAQAAGSPASTVHRLLGLRGDGAQPERSGSNPLTADLVVCDESSMLDVELAAMLTDALKDGARLVLVGDADQLPPPGAGDALAELLVSPVISHFQLSQVFRQAERSTLLRAAAKIRVGAVPRFTPREGDVADLSGFWSKSESELIDEAVRQAREVLPQKLGIDPDEVQVIAPMYRGGAGIDELNRRLREAANPSGEKIIGGRLRVGDKLIQTKNDYSLVAESGEPLVNGAFCQVHGYRDGRDGGLEANCEDGSRIFIPTSQSPSLKLGYAISVHKSQGSEWPGTVVVIPPAERSSFLTRRLLRTALTRARRHCHVVACPTTFRAAIGRADQQVRNCAVVERIEDSFERAIQRELEADLVIAP